MKIGVVVGRFQTPALTQAHRLLLKQAEDENDRLVILIQDTHVKSTSVSPLPYVVREHMVAQFCGNHLSKTVDIYPIMEQKYASVLVRMIDDILLENHGAKADYTLYTRVGGLPYDGMCALKEVNFAQSHTSGSLRGSAYDGSATSFQQLNGMIHTIGHQEGEIHNYVVGLIKKDKGILIIREPGTKLFSLPTVKFHVNDTSMEEALLAHITTISQSAICTPCDYIKGFMVDDWRYRNSENTAYYNVFTCRWMSGNLEELEYYASPFNPNFFEPEYRAIIQHLS